MRNLFILRGIPGCGKSTWIKENNLENFTLSSDTIRLLYQAPHLNINGTYSITQKNDDIVWNTLKNILEFKMINSETVFIDATHYKNVLIESYNKLADKYNYRMYVVDFSDTPLETCMKRNKDREQFRRVPSNVLDKMYKTIKSEKPIKRAQYLKPDEVSKFIYNIDILDFNSYKKLVIFGDIHGCYEPIKEYFDNNPYSDEIAYIFTGDYIDRGLENSEVLEFLTSLCDNKNVIFLEGNHEKWLRNFGDEDYDKICSREFMFSTYKQLKNFDKKIIRKFVRRLSLYKHLNFGKYELFINHSGYPRIPDKLTLGKDLTDGIGEYSDIRKISESWYEYSNFCNNVIQIHAHRNNENISIEDSMAKRCVNLCDSVEKGGFLRIVEIEKDSIKPIYIKNNLFKKSYFNNYEQFKELPLIDNPNNDKEIAAINDLNKNTSVKKKILNDNIISYSFDRDIFDNGKWDNINIKARGLFINSNTNKVVARSYDKFFNLNEVKETKLENLKNNLNYPLEIFVKENGFLGLVSYNQEKDELFVSSKSMSDGEFKDYFESFVKDLKKLSEIKQFLKENNKTLIFEVIDIINDPHIIKYDKSKIVLLDIVSNFLTEPEYYNYNDLVEFAEKYELEVKHKIQYTSIKNEKDLIEFLKVNEIFNNKIDNLRKFKLLEGYVIKDASGFRFKIKLPYYSFWKKMRTLKNSLLFKKEIDENRLSSDAKYVFNFIKKFNLLELAEMSIVDIAEKFYEEG